MKVVHLWNELQTLKWMSLLWFRICIDFKACLLRLSLLLFHTNWISPAFNSLKSFISQLYWFLSNHYPTKMKKPLFDKCPDKPSELDCEGFWRVSVYNVKSLKSNLQKSGVLSKKTSSLFRMLHDQFRDISVLFYLHVYVYKIIKKKTLRRKSSIQLSSIFSSTLYRTRNIKIKG